ncbi:Fur family transcriptional regulator [Pediococcus cellicola]|uniref:Fe2+ Zn2+ uptake regulation protein n=1 Tax=Pediococcus cellicola TaxID=319652 RepID=A0A0R2IQN2_9LACO|nr:Fur family transcriptional regulator [Pediococcus cellicola]KRN67355.1 Fe2+ Zn2+ uptake regulation protein [Pediococcus cellicola]GEL16080.1 transcriptional repressor [Pediococcus cellicola]
MGSEVDEAFTELQRRHVRMTPQRRTILTYLVTHHNHPTVETIHEALDQQTPNMSLATIYNTLKLFVDLGIVIELANGEDGVHYDYYNKPHYHAICTNCGRIADVFYPDFPKVAQQLEKEAADQTGYQITGNHIEVYGLCPQCQKKLNSKS